MIKEIEAKQKKLKEIGIILKKQYRGIDKQIDSVMEKIETWYIFDDVLYKPTVICLWGLTGIGKTGLIRDLVKLLEMYNVFCEIDVSRTTAAVDGRRNNYRRFYGESHSIASQLFDVVDDTREKCILLVDEVTKIDFKNNNGRFSDLWNLLSDGRLGNGVSTLSKYDQYIEDLEDELNKYDLNSSQSAFDKMMEEAKQAAMAGNTAPMMPFMNNQWNPYTQPIPGNKRYYILREFLDVNKFEDLNPLFDFIEFSGNPQTSLFPFGIREMYRTAWENGNFENLTDIIKQPGIAYVQPLLAMVKNIRERTIKEMSEVGGGRDPLVFSKMLIFIAGNVDGLYEDHKNIEIDADELHAKTDDISLDLLRDELLKVFKPEEVARLGGNHIVYPSLSRNAFEQIINDNLKLIEEDTKRTTDITVSLRSKKFVDHLYKVGVIPSQGARPLISRIQTEVSKFLPKLIKIAITGGTDKISITQLNGNFQ